MNFILKNYLIIILVGLFFVFALIGYLVDMLRNNKEKEEEIIDNNIKPIELKDISQKKEEIILENKDINNNLDNGDDLLKNYDENIIE